MIYELCICAHDVGAKRSQTSVNRIYKTPFLGVKTNSKRTSESGGIVGKLDFQHMRSTDRVV